MIRNIAANDLLNDLHNMAFVDQASASTPVIVSQERSHDAFCPFDKFPLELFYHCLKFMPLQSLILCRTVCKDWRRLVLEYCNHDAVMRRLVELYGFVVKSRVTPLFLSKDDDAMGSEDRKLYIENLLKKAPNIPEEFHLWMLEWPAFAVRPGQWPDDPPIIRTQLLRPGEVFNLEVGPTLAIKDIEGEYVFHETWLILDERPEYFGQVIVRRATYIKCGESDFDADERCEKYDDWIEYQRALWERYDGYEQLPEAEGPPDLVESD